MFLHVSWNGFWWLVELMGILAVTVIWLVPFRMRPKGGDRVETRPPTSGRTLRPATAPAEDLRETIHQ